MHCTCEASISKSTFCFATIQLKAEHDASVSGAAAYQPRRGGEQNFFSLQQSLCPWPGVAGCEQHEYVDCIKPSHHALPAIKHKNRKISRWEANYLQVKNGLSKYFEGELQALLKRSVTRERSHTWYKCTAQQCFQFSELIQNTFTCLEIGLF